MIDDEVGAQARRAIIARVLSIIVAVMLSPAGQAPTPSADPDPPPPSAHDISLDWAAPPECPDGPAFLAAVQRLSGRALTLRPDADQHVHARIRSAASGYALHLEVTSPTEQTTRDLEAPACDAVVDAASLVVMTRLLSEDPPDQAVPVVPAPPPAEETSPAKEPAARVPVEPVRSPAATDDVVASPPAPVPAPPPRITPPRLAFAAMGGGAFGFTPRPTGSIAGSVAVVFEHGRAEVQAQHGFATATDDVAGRRVRAALTRIGALGCYTPTLSRLDFPLCTGLDVGVAVGRGEGELANSNVSRQTWVGLPVQAGLGWAPVPRFALRATGGMSVGLRRPGFHLATPEGPGGVFRVPAVVGSILGGIEVRLP